MMMTSNSTAVRRGREHIAKLAEADGHRLFAREVRGGCWDHRSDVVAAIERAEKELQNVKQ